MYGLASRPNTRMHEGKNRTEQNRNQREKESNADGIVYLGMVRTDKVINLRAANHFMDSCRRCTPQGRFSKHLVKVAPLMHL